MCNCLNKSVCPTLSLYFVSFVLFTVFTFTADKLVDFLSKDQPCTNTSTPLWEQTLDFEFLNFSNQTGSPGGCYLVPNYIHFIHFGGAPVTYVQLVCILAALRNQQPEKMFFHYDNETTFTGKYWQVLLELEGFTGTLVRNKVDLPLEVYGQRLRKKWREWHAGDIARIRALMKYGGMCIDTDCYIVKSLDNYRRFEFTLNWDDGQFMASQTLMGHKDARFLKKYLQTYKAYNKDKWYYNAGERPTVKVLNKQPELIHRVKVLFGSDIKYGYRMFNRQWNHWKDMYVIHLFHRHFYNYKNLTKKATYPVVLNENNIAYYDITFREMAYELYDFANVTWPKNRFNTELDWPRD